MLLELLLKGPRDKARPVALTASLAFIVGGLLLLWSSYIHFHLWQKLGYRHIPTIGPLFLVQVVAGVLVGLFVGITRRVGAAVIGIGFAVFTMVGFLISVEHGLFGFKDSWSAPFADQAFIIESAAIGVLLLAGLLCLVGPGRTELRSSS